MASEEKKPRTFNPERGMKTNAQEVLYNVYKFFAAAKKANNLTCNVTNMTSEATGVSTSTIARARKVAREKAAGIYVKPQKKRGGQNKVLFDKDTEDKIRQIFHEVHAVEKEHMTLMKLHERLTKENIISCGKEVLRLKVAEMNLNWTPNRKANQYTKRIEPTPESCDALTETCEQ